MMGVEEVRDCVKEIPIGGQQDCTELLSHGENLEIFHSLVQASPKVEDLISRSLQERNRCFRKILVQEKLHATAS